MKCPCGYTVFDQRLRVASTPNQTRWFPTSTSACAGAGALPLGTLAGSTSVWGRTALTVHTGAVQMLCASCGRLRGERAVGGGMLLGTWSKGAAIYALMSDVADPACVTARLESPTRRIDVGVELAQVEVPALPSQGVAAVLPLGAVVGDVIYKIKYPSELDQAAEPYTVTLIDACLNITQHVTDIGAA